MDLPTLLVDFLNVHLDFMFLSSLPLPFLLGKTIRLGKRLLPSPLRETVDNVCLTYEAGIRPMSPSLQTPQMLAFPQARALRQVARFYKAITGVYLLPAVIDVLVPPVPKLMGRIFLTKTSSPHIIHLYPNPMASLLPHSAGQWGSLAVTGLMACMQGIWSSHRVSVTLSIIDTTPSHIPPSLRKAWYLLRYYGFLSLVAEGPYARLWVALLGLGSFMAHSLPLPDLFVMIMC